MTNHSTRLAATRTAASVFVVTVSALLAACGSRPSAGPGASPQAGGSGSPSAVAYSACMRSHGVPSFPDPTPGSNGSVPKADPGQLGVSASRFSAAQLACAQLIPGTGSTDAQQEESKCAQVGQCSQAVVQQWMGGLRTLAQCLRTHGVPNWPDPVISSNGLPHFPYDQAGIDHHSPQILARVSQCVSLTGFQGLPLP